MSVSLIAFCFGALCLFFGVVSGGSIGLKLPPLTRFTANTSRCDDTCSRLTDYCLRVSCTVTNTGPFDGTARVELKVNRKGEAPLSRITEVDVPRGESRIVSHDFSDASFFSSGERCACTIR